MNIPNFNSYHFSKTSHPFMFYEEANKFCFMKPLSPDLHLQLNLFAKAPVCAKKKGGGVEIENGLWA